MIAAPEAPRAFKNNLVQGDRVFCVPTSRFGTVNWSPRKPDQRMICVLLDGTSSPRYFDVLEVRLVVDGIAEDVPPIDGKAENAPPLPGATGQTAAIPRNPPPQLISVIPGLAELKRARDDLDVGIRSIVDRHATLKAQRERLAQAIDILEPSKKPIEVPRIGAA